MVKFLDSQERFEKILNYYIGCIEKEDMKELFLNYQREGDGFWTTIFQSEELFLEKKEQIIVQKDKKLVEALNKNKIQSGQKTIFYGYPICINEFGEVSPIFFVELLLKEDDSTFIFTKESVNPEFNHYILKDFDFGEEEILGVHLKVTDMDHFKVKLEYILELLSFEFTPSSVIDKRPLQKTGVFRILNKAMLFFSERTGYSKGLLFELNSLKKKYYYAPNSSLSYLISRHELNKDRTSLEKNTLEMYPMNDSQEDAVRMALKKSVSVITGPPGSGKSQVVSNIIANALWEDKTVLFASKNNRAVDVVYEKFEKTLERNNHIVRMGNKESRIKAKERMNELVQTIYPASNGNDLENALVNVKKIDGEIFDIDQQINELKRLNEQINDKSNEINVLEKNMPDGFSYKVQGDHFAFLNDMNPANDSDNFKKEAVELQGLNSALEISQMKLKERASKLHPPCNILTRLDNLKFEEIHSEKLKDDCVKSHQIVGLIRSIENDMKIIGQIENLTNLNLLSFAIVMYIR